MIYCIDTSAILDAAVRYYPPDTFPSFWSKLSLLADQKRLISHEHVVAELDVKEGDVAHEWAKEHSHLFEDACDETESLVQSIMSQCPELVKESKPTRNFADPFVIAVAEARGALLLTGEKSSGNMRKPKIPDVCNAREVKSGTLLEMIRREKWSF